MKSSLYPLVVALPAMVLAYPSQLTARSHGVVTSPEDVANRTFDYIITGGGLTGLAVASKLSEDPSKTVLVIEAGENHESDPRVYDVRTYGQAFESEIDYNITSTPISWRNGTRLSMAAGKALGGSGSINGASWTKGPKTQYDLLPILTGDESWGFEAFNKKMLQAENFNPPAADLVAKGAKYDPASHAHGGPVQVSFAQGMFGSIQVPALQASDVVWKGLQRLADVASGVVNGATTIPNMVQPDISQNRSSPFAAYIAGEPETRKNLVILTGHRAIRINWEGNDTAGGDDLVASSVDFQAARDSPVLTAHVRNEVLLASGSMQSPQLLELSGVGSPSVLSAAGVPLVKALEGVGKNLQEQTKNSVFYTPKSLQFDGTGPSSAIAFPNVHQLLGEEQAEIVYAETMASLPSYAASLASEGLVASESGTLDILRHQVENLFNASEAAAEIFFTLTPSAQNVGIDLWNLIVLARGTIHISTNSSWDLPVVEPSYFKHPLDLQLQTLATMQSRQVYETAPLSDYVTEETFPGLDVVPHNASYSIWEEWVKDTFTSVWHPIATLSCMKRELGGVVDERLKVYGLANVRAVDASVLPVQLSAHLSSSLYGIAEKAAEMIKADNE
ncbi:hypothetical protein AAFC00_002333 [Neodothiora populina]|uniref:Glucose-methanol-choline oxidoreductase N-terminal domain-containing protein n=1 Tax=Neodothiora populina TaxID=2781224 RepID=A0ABR3PH58_9PEZI